MTDHVSLALMQQQSTPQICYKFGDYVLDPARQTLLRDGIELELRPQSFEVLLVLVANRDRLVTKEQLHSEVWGNVAVTDSSITHCISDIRKVLDDADKSIVRTVPRRGFIFAADVSETVTSQDAGLRTRTTPRKRLVIIGAAAVIAVVGWWLVQDRQDDLASFAEFPANSLAVLPFEGSRRMDTAGSPYLGNEFSDELRDQLERVGGLRVAARASSVAVLDLESDTTRMAGKLGVLYLVKGSFRQRANDLRISARLIDAETSETLWAQTYDRRPAEMLAIQQAIAEEIVRLVLPDARATIASTATLNPTANEMLLLARHKEQQVREQQEVDVPLLLEAVQLYRTAINADPSSALAHSRLAGALLYLGDVRGAEAPMLRALTLDAELSEVQETLGRYYWARDNDSADAAFKKALELNPNNADALGSYAWSRWMATDGEDAAQFYRRALELDPLSLLRHADLGNYLGIQGRVDETRDVIARVQRIFDSAESLQLTARLLELIGEVDRSIAFTIKARDREPDDPSHVWKLAELYAVIGDFETAGVLQPDPGIGLLFLLRRYSDLIDKAEVLMIEQPGDVMVRYLLAFAYNATGNFDAAIRVLNLSGLPDVALRNTRQPEDLEALVTLINANDGAGNRSSALELANAWMAAHHIEHPDWWMPTHHACVYSVLGQDEAALMNIERVRNSARLPWVSVLLDSRCFARFATEPRFRAVIDAIESRRAELRQRLPETLQEYGAAL